MLHHSVLSAAPLSAVCCRLGRLKNREASATTQLSSDKTRDGMKMQVPEAPLATARDLQMAI